MKTLVHYKNDKRQHYCHAIQCNVPVPPEMFMCRKHWYMVPKSLRDEIWKTYRPGQCEDKAPSREYLKATYIAIKYVRQIEFDPTDDM